VSKPTVNTKPVMPAGGLVRVSQLLGCRRDGIVPILPILRNGICAAIRDGRVPPPIKTGLEVIAWPSEQARAMLDGIKAVGQ